MTISKFESNISPGLKDLGFSFKIPDAGPGFKPFDFILGISCKNPITGNEYMRMLAIEGKTARGNRFLFGSLWRPHQRKALDMMERMAYESAWVALHYPHTDVPAFLLPWGYYRVIEAEYEKSIPVDAWHKRYQLLWDYGPRRQKKYWQVPVGHPMMSQKT